MKSLNIEKEYNYIKIDGKYFQPDAKDGQVIFKPIKKKEILVRITKAKKMTKILEKSLDKEKVLMEAIMLLEDSGFNTLYKSLTSGKKLKPKTRKHRCVDMKVGNFILPIIDT